LFYLAKGLTGMDRRIITLRSLKGLALGDAFGEMFFRVSPELIRLRQIPDGRWRWTDDTHMALSIVDVLFSCGHIDEDMLAKLFAKRYMEEPWRGYGSGAHRLLRRLAGGADWREEAPKLFNGGSYGNGGAMRVAPLGAFFSGNPEVAAREAKKSAHITHAHPEGQAGAIAVAVATAIVSADSSMDGIALLKEILRYIPPSLTKDKIEEAIHIGGDDLEEAITRLGTGQEVAAFDTVPFCLWVVANHSRDYETALWTTVRGLGDRDTTCAIVGGVVGSYRQLPDEWLEHLEPLPEEYSRDLSME